MKDIDRLIELVKFTNEFRGVLRIVFSEDHPRQESDSEHAFQLALSAWYIIDSKKLNLDLNKVFKYALAHDLVEVYAGDTYFYTKDPKERESKKEREAEAAKKIEEKFPEFPELHHIIEGYENRIDEESRFIYALDKVLAPINIYLDGGKGWHERNVTLDILVENKTPKIELSPEVLPYWNELMEIFKEKENEHFPIST